MQVGKMLIEPLSHHLTSHQFHNDFHAPQMTSHTAQLNKPQQDPSFYRPDKISQFNEENGWTSGNPNRRNFKSMSPPR